MRFRVRPDDFVHLLATSRRFFAKSCCKAILRLVCFSMPPIQRLLLSVLCLTPFAVHAQTGLSLRLVSEQSAIVPGKTLTVGLYLQPDRGWHTYWRCPGIVGVPTRMEWKLPRGWKAGNLIYPEPERTLMFNIKAQGYDRDVILRTEITPPANLKIGEMVTLVGRASWMCCESSCHPGSTELSLTLPVAAEAEVEKKWHRLLEEERARVEQRSDAWSASVREIDEKLTLQLRPVTAEARVSKSQREANKIIVFTEDGWFDTDKPQIIQRAEDGSLTITLIKADAYAEPRPPEKLRAIVRNEEGWLQGGALRCLQIAPRIERGARAKN